MSELSSSNWSETAASNNASTPNGWPEGQLPGSINDCAREMMSALKKFWNRIQGGYASTGSSNAYVLTPTVALGAYVTGERYSFRANFANTGSATLNISSLGAKTIKKFTASGKAALSGGEIQSGQPVTVEYDGTDLLMVTPVTSGLGNRAYDEYTTNEALTTTIPADDTIPQNTEGTEILSAAITPLNTSSRVRVRFQAWGTTGDDSNAVVAALFKDSGASALAATIQTIATTDNVYPVVIEFEHAPATTSEITYKVRVGPATTGTVRLNGNTLGRILGGAGRATLVIEEIPA